MSEEKQLLAINITDDMAPVIYQPNGLDQFFEQIKAAVSSEVADLSTKKGRDRIASLAAQVSRSKTAVEKPGREYLKRLKAAVKPTEQEIKRFVDKCDDLRDEVRKPLTEFENAEKQRVADLQQRLLSLRSCADVVDELGNVPPADEISSRLESVKSTAIDESWQEVTAEAGVAKDAAITKLEAALKTALQREAEAEELERLRVEQAAAAQREREAQIQREAEDRARREAVEKSLAELAAAAQREADAKAAAERAEQGRIAAEQRAEREKQEAVEAERLRAQQAEQARIAEEKKAAEKAKAKATDIEHRRTVNRSVVAGLVAAGVPEDCAKKCVEAVARMQVPHITINY